MNRIRISKLDGLIIAFLFSFLIACNLGSATDSNQVDVVFVFDTTGSMSGSIASMKFNAANFANELAAAGMDYRLGLTEMKDFPDSCDCGDSGDFAYKIYNSGDLVNSAKIFNAWISSLYADGGADWQEAHLAALHHTITDQHWSAGTVQKVIILISDAPPHADGSCCNVEGDTFAGIKNTLKSNSVKLFIAGYDTGGNGVPDGWATDLAKSTGGKYYPLGDLTQILKDISGKIEAIDVSPQYPLTTKDVTLNATVLLPDNYEILGSLWTVKDAKTGFPERIGFSNPWTFKPADGKHGEKNAVLFVTFKNKETGDLGVDVKSKSFKIFFEKGTADTPADANNDGIPNWFEYWKRDGAVPGMENFEYDKSHPDVYGYHQGGKLYLCKLAGGDEGPFTITLDDGKTKTTETLYDNFDFEGINCIASTVAHESYHKRVYDKSEFPSGMDLKDEDTWPGPDNVQKCWDSNCKPYNNGAPCLDGLPSEYEDKTSHTELTKPDTYNFTNNFPKPADLNGITTLHSYAFNGDQELMAFRKDSAKPVVDETKDWANPGKQTPTVHEPSSVAKPLKVIPKQTPTESRIVGNYMDSTVDTNGNGLFDNLKINFDVEVDKDDIYSLTGRLKDNSDQEIELTSRLFSLSAGVNNVELAFEGTKINSHGVNGPYTFSVALSDRVGNRLDSQEDAYQTASYDYTDFEGQQAKLADGFTDTAEDSNGDGIFDNLKINVNVDVKVSGKYAVEGYLYGDSDNAIAFAKINASLTEGLSGVELAFSGSDIAFGSWNGQYKLRYLSLYDESGTRLGFELDPYQTKEYEAKDFKSADASLGDCTHAGQDANGDGFFEYLKISVGVDVSKAGNYVIMGDLRDPNGDEIEMNDTPIYIDVGKQTVPLMFKGKTIYAHGVDGAFKLINLLLLDESGAVEDNKKDAYTTGNYNHGAFKPLVALTGGYSDYGEDTNSNGLFEDLVVNVGVEVAKSGNVVAKARLLDPSGNEICLATNTASIEAGGSKTIPLKFDGPAIYKHGVNGPYLVSDLNVYHTLDSAFSDYPNEVYTTSAYTYPKFEQESNHPPNTPSIPSGPKSGYAWVPYSYSTSATDPDGDQVKYTLDWGDGATSTTGLVDNGTIVSAPHTWGAAGTYQVKAMATDNKEATSEWSSSLAVTIAKNNPPNTPTLTGTTSGKLGTSYVYLTSATDPNGDQVKYTFDWGDGTTSTTALVKSGVKVSLSHRWTTAGTYLVKITATDSKGAPSLGSSSLTVKIAAKVAAKEKKNPKARTVLRSPLSRTRQTT